MKKKIKDMSGHFLSPLPPNPLQQKLFLVDTEKNTFYFYIILLYAYRYIQNGLKRTILREKIQKKIPYKIHTFTF